MAQAQVMPIPDRPVHPAPQPAAAHGGDRRVHEPDEGMVARPAQGRVDLQIATARRIEQHAVLLALDLQALHVPERRALGLGGILEQAPGGAERGGQVLASEGREIGDPEMTRQRAAGALRVEMPGWAAAEPPDGRELAAKRRVLAHQDLRRPQPADLRPETFTAGHLR